ncbi:DNA (cytosine-5)-methyltransferase 3B-like [Ruditapes philippinarum]|uniref:DNA (cytosine-5)-methyltransferase 3B-like n=1 Tax=Ruditapes philippinarum TaxID=129788 RepID=UPI00295A9682|nr:DNA (cytosine-5)-methyltransferase 3B-like [Ruditapes philippinarum]
MDRFSNGQLVWGHILKSSWWPALVFPGPMAGKSHAKPGAVWVIWLQDLKISEMKFNKLENFASNFTKHRKGKYSSALEQAVVEALEVCAHRAGLSIDNIKQWGLVEEGFIDLVNSSGDTFEPKSGFEYPNKVVSALKEAKNRSDIVRLEVEKKKKLEIDKLKKGEKGQKGEQEKKEQQKEEQIVVLNDTAAGSREHENVMINEVCLSCAKEKAICHHPLFEGYVCSKCKGKLMESLLTKNRDGTYMFCCVCGKGCKMYRCADMTCGRLFCKRCLKENVSVNMVQGRDRICGDRNPWLCMLCTQYKTYNHGKLVPRDNWREELVKFFNPVSDQVTVMHGDVSRRKMRVLVLFNGAERVRRVLDELDINVELFCVVDNVYALRKDKLKQLCPIDLVVAFPPCHDLDVTNKEQTGFNETGSMMIKFWLIVQDIEVMCKGMNDVYWLVECKASMRTKYRELLSNFFEREPCMWDTQFFLPSVYNPKFYWGNIPSLYSSFQYYKEKKGYITTLSQESFYATSDNRSAQVKRSNNNVTVINNKKAKRNTENDNKLGTDDKEEESIDTDDNQGEGIDIDDNQGEGIDIDNNQGEGIDIDDNQGEGIDIDNNQGEGIDIDNNQGEGIDIDNNQGEGIDIDNNQGEGIDTDDLQEDRDSDDIQSTEPEINTAYNTTTSLPVKFDWKDNCILADER